MSVGGSLEESNFFSYLNLTGPIPISSLSSALESLIGRCHYRHRTTVRGFCPWPKRYHQRRSWLAIWFFDIEKCPWAVSWVSTVSPIPKCGQKSKTWYVEGASNLSCMKFPVGGLAVTRWPHGPWCPNELKLFDEPDLVYQNFPTHVFRITRTIQNRSPRPLSHNLGLQNHPSPAALELNPRESFVSERSESARCIAQGVWNDLGLSLLHEGFQRKTHLLA